MLAIKVNFLFCSASLERRLVDHLDREHLFRLQVHAFVAFGESAYHYQMRTFA
jgi:hypothetical protein